jgi:hypothetical protein
MIVSEDTVSKALDHLTMRAEDAAKARAERIYVEEYRKTVKAQIMQEHTDLPIGAQEREAYADPRYTAHLEAIRQAITEDERMRFLREAATATIEAWRTQSSNERAGKL